MLGRAAGDVSTVHEFDPQCVLLGVLHAAVKADDAKETVRLCLRGLVDAFCQIVCPLGQVGVSSACVTGVGATLTFPLPPSVLLALACLRLLLRPACHTTCPFTGVAGYGRLVASSAASVPSTSTASSRVHSLVGV